MTSTTASQLRVLARRLDRYAALLADQGLPACRTALSKSLRRDAEEVLILARQAEEPGREMVSSNLLETVEDAAGVE